ncbi:hypothetical protein [Curtobacterium sp. MCSS17_007]|uniref:hypothetical protein n=1 Tax=Curtobacterium sp. MCSS17_007 TaxID=2175646 RepID=UPI000DA79D83|nr:hypothetical protein [Curtobacterium sp. MCSS17_007]WIE74991.1 hypothetical protein DEJ22_012090 [Curtobacterium sp. MCSS17_007]
MVIYDARPVRTAAQVLLDLVVVAGIVGAVLLGRAVSASISSLAAIGGRVQEQGSAFEDQLRQTAGALGDVPLVGRSVSGPLEDASRSAGRIAAAGAQQQEETLHLAHLLGTSLAVVLVVVLVVVWCRYRGGFIRRASATQRLAGRPDGTELLAVRALTTRDAAGRLGVDVVDRWRRRDPETILALADLERRGSGLRTTAPARRP